MGHGDSRSNDIVRPVLFFYINDSLRITFLCHTGLYEQAYALADRIVTVGGLCA